jgi:hypothetical protein
MEPEYQRYFVGASHRPYWFVATIPPWKKVPAVYMFAIWTDAGWCIVCVGECDDAANRFSNHERWPEAVQLGVTHVFTHEASADEEARRREERDLILALDPPMNKQHRRGLLDAAPYRRSDEPPPRHGLLGLGDLVPRSGLGLAIPRRNP